MVDDGVGSRHEGLADEVDLIVVEHPGSLDHELKRRFAELNHRPRLDLGLEPENLIKSVPFFAGLSAERTAELAKLLQPRLAIPGERIVSKGEPGDAMYFIPNGAVEVALGSDNVQLGSGDFFGEMALLNQRPRNADVTAKGFCDLLVLWVRDFRQLIDKNPQMRETMEAVAQQRLDYKAPRSD